MRDERDKAIEAALMGLLDWYHVDSVDPPHPRMEAAKAALALPTPPTAPRPAWAEPDAQHPERGADAARLAEIDARVEAATPGEWTATECDMSGHRSTSWSRVYNGTHHHFDIDWPHHIADAAFIAAARADIPWLRTQLDAVVHERDLAEERVLAVLNRADQLERERDAWRQRHGEKSDALCDIEQDLRTQLDAMREERDEALTDATRWREEQAEIDADLSSADDWISENAKIRALPEAERAAAVEDARARGVFDGEGREPADYTDLMRTAATMPGFVRACMQLKEASARAETAERERDEARAQLAAERARADAAEEASRCLRAALWLCAYEEAFPRSPDGGMFLISAEPVADIDGDPVLIVLANDTFDYACADGEPLALSEAPDLLAIGRREGWPGIVRWVQTKRQARGEKSEPIKPVQESMDRISIAIATAEQAGFARGIEAAAKVCEELAERDEPGRAANDGNKFDVAADAVRALSPQPAAPSPAQPVAPKWEPTVNGVTTSDNSGPAQPVAVGGVEAQPWGSSPTDAKDPNYGRVCIACNAPVRAGERYGHMDECPARSALAEHGKVRR